MPHATDWVMQQFSNDRPDDALEDEWFSKEKPTWKPPPRQSSRPPKETDELDQEVDGWFV
jgi:hypothetical protein